MCWVPKAGRSDLQPQGTLRIRRSSSLQRSGSTGSPRRIAHGCRCRTARPSLAVTPYKWTTVTLSIAKIGRSATHTTHPTSSHPTRTHPPPARLERAGSQLRPSCRFFDPPDLDVVRTSDETWAPRFLAVDALEVMSAMEKKGILPREGRRQSGAPAETIRRPSLSPTVISVHRAQQFTAIFLSSVATTSSLFLQRLHSVTAFLCLSSDTGL